MHAAVHEWRRIEWCPVDELRWPSHVSRWAAIACPPWHACGLYRTRRQGRSPAGRTSDATWPTRDVGGKPFAGGSVQKLAFPPPACNTNKSLRGRPPPTPPKITCARWRVRCRVPHPQPVKWEAAKKGSKRLGSPGSCRLLLGIRTPWHGPEPRTLAAESTNPAYWNCRSRVLASDRRDRLTHSWR